MKKKLILIKLFLGFLVLAFVFLLLYTKNNDATNVNNSIRFILNLSLEEKKEDYEYFWDYIYNGWPFLEICERRDIELEKIKAEGYKKLEDLKFKADYNNFYADLCYQITGRKYIGHFWPASYNDYKVFKENYEYPLINIDGSENKKIINFYSSYPDDPYYYSASFQTKNDKTKSYENKRTMPQTRIIEQGKIAYIRIDTFDLGKNKEKRFFSIIEKFLIETKNYKHLIIDISRNTGGNPNHWFHLVRMASLKNDKLVFKSYVLYNKNKYTKPYLDKVLSNFQISEIPIEKVQGISKANTKKHKNAFVYTLDISLYSNFLSMDPMAKRKNWLLISKNTFSAADCFASFCKGSSWATLVGEPSGGGGLVFPGPRFVVLPNSGLMIKTDFIYGLNQEGYCNNEYGTAPDIYIEKGKTALETCLDAIKEYDKNNP